MSASRLRTSLQRRAAAGVRRRQGLDSLPLTLRRRRIYILPTRAGLGFALMLFFMLVAGLNYANSAALFLAFLLAGFGLVTMHQCHRNLLGLRLDSAGAAPVFARTDGTVQLLLENSTGAAQYRIEAGIESGITVCTDLRAGARDRVDLRLPAPARGRVRIERLRLGTAHPFGLFRAWSWVHLPLQMIVYPHPAGSLPMPADDGRRSGRLANISIGMDEWLGLRAFRDGDSPRQVDWKAYAREAPLLVKEYGATAGELRMFRFAGLVRLSVEDRLEQLARWVVDAEALGERYGIELPSLAIPPGRGPEHRHRCLSALALHGLQP